MSRADWQLYALILGASVVAFYVVFWEVILARLGAQP
jgi:hypothetical protein